MPLLFGKKNIGHNVKVEEQAGKPKEQAVAIALSKAGAKDDEEDGPVEAHGVKGMKSTPWRKTFKNQKAFEQWLEKNEGDVEVQGTRKTEDSTTQYATPPRKPHVLTSVALPNPVDVAKAYAPHKAEEFKKTFGKDDDLTDDVNDAMKVLALKGRDITAEDIAKKFGYSPLFIKDVLAGRYGTTRAAITEYFKAHPWGGPGTGGYGVNDTKAKDAATSRKYRAIITSPKMLLGGTKRHVSSWFDSEADARSWAATIIQTNEKAGRGPCQFELQDMIYEGKTIPAFTKDAVGMPIPAGMEMKKTGEEGGDGPEWRVNFKGGKEATAYYTTDKQDAIDTAVAMFAQRAKGKDGVKIEPHIGTPSSRDNAKCGVCGYALSNPAVHTNAASAQMQDTLTTAMEEAAAEDAFPNKDHKCFECGEKMEQTGRNTWYCPSCDVCPDCGEPQADGNWHDAKCPRMKGKDSVTPQDRLTAAMEHEVAGDKRKALDYYKQARATATDSAAKHKAEDGIAACQGYFARCADAAKYQHPEAGKTKKYDSRAKALDAAVMRTRAGERVTVRGYDVMPTKDVLSPVRVGGRDEDEAYVVISGQTGKEVSKPVSKKIAEEMMHELFKSTGGVFTMQKTARPLASDNLPAPVRVGGRDDATGNAMNDGHLAEIKKAWNSKIYAHYRTIYNAEGKAAADKYLQQFTTRKITDTTLSPVRVGGRDGFAPGVGPNANPVLKAYESYRDMDTARLKEIYKRSHKVSDLNGVPKRDLIADLLEGEFGRKRVDAAFAGKSKDSLSPVKVVAA